MRLKEQRSQAGPSTTRGRDPSPAPEAAILRLQRDAGNRAVTSLIQNAMPALPAARGTALLDEKSVAAALTFYRNQPGRYPKTVIGQIQEALSLPKSGVADEAFVQAVATYQFSSTDLPQIKADGKAGARTLARIFPTGLADAERARQFGAETQTGVIDRWKELGTAQARAEAVASAVNRRLASVEVPKFTTTVIAMEGPSGAFDYTNWNMQLNKAKFERPKLDAEQARGVAGTVYHEARHCEQWFRMAQSRASRGEDAAAIQKRMGIPEPVAREAAARPLAASSAAFTLADEWFESFYPPDGVFDHNSATISATVAAKNAVNRAQDAFDKNPTRANQARLDRARTRFLDKAYPQYQALATENDAFTTAARSEAAVTRGTEEPAAQQGSAPISGPDSETRPPPGEQLASIPEFPDPGDLFADDDVLVPVGGAPEASDELADGKHGPHESGENAVT